MLLASSVVSALFFCPHASCGRKILRRPGRAVRGAVQGERVFERLSAASLHDRTDHDRAICGRRRRSRAWHDFVAAQIVIFGVFLILFAGAACAAALILPVTVY